MYLTAVGECADSRGAVNPEANVALVRLMGLAGVQPRPHPRRDAIVPALRCNCTLRCNRPQDRISDAPEHDKERVSLRVNLGTALSRKSDRRSRRCSARTSA